MADQLSCNRTPDQDRHGVNAKQNSIPDTDLLNVANLRQTGRQKTEDGTGAETEENSKCDDGTGARDRQPDSKHEDCGNEARANENGEAAYFVGKIVGDCTPKG